MKKMIGDHFHFTAYGIDWIEDRWLKGNPPTYLEFGIFWEQECLKRLEKRETPKEEWAYINFTQRFLDLKPTASKAEILSTWEKEQAKHVRLVKELLKSIDLSMT
jgi:hypothetical protein